MLPLEGFCIIFTLLGVPTVHPITAAQSTNTAMLPQAKGLVRAPPPHPVKHSLSATNLTIQQLPSLPPPPPSLGLPNLPGRTVTKQRQLTDELYTVSGGHYSKSPSAGCFGATPLPELSIDLVTRSPPPKLCSFSNNNKAGEMSYYHGLISSRRASALLTSQGDGSFLIRDSQSQPGSFVLSVKSVSLHVSTLIARLTVSLSSSHV